MGVGTVLLAVAGLLLLLLVVASCLSRANRLDRLHVRADAARAALHAALERRAVVARAIAAGTGDERLHATATSAERAPMRDREEAENDLGRLLMGLDRTALPVGLADELADAEHRVMLSRRVHNDAVRDILALRSRRFVRWLRLAGNAPAPTYFEITDGLGEDEGPPDQPPTPRRAGRVVLLDPAGRVLLFEGVDPLRARESCWFTPGGDVEPGEDARTAAARELAERTGMELPCEGLEGPVWRRHSVSGLSGDVVAVDEEFFVALWPGPGHCAERTTEPNGPTGPERATVLSHRWWDADELRTTDAVVRPERLADLLGSVRPGDWDGVTRSIS